MIQYNPKDNVFHISTAETSYIFRILKSGHPAQLYYGRKISHRDDFQNLYRETTIAPGSTTSYSSKNPGFSLDMVCLENAGWGKGDYRTPSIMLRDNKGDRTFDFLYERHSFKKGKPPIPGLPSARQAGDREVETLELELADKSRDITVILSYSVFPSTDMITRSLRIINKSRETVTLDKVMSFNLDIDSERLNITTLDGAWIRERHPHTTPVRPGMTSVSSRRGVSSSNHSPFLMLQDPDGTEQRGDCYGFALVYSGNHQSDVELSPHGMTRIQMGINSFDFSWQLNAGESFYSPEAALTFSHKGRNGMSQHFHKFVQDHIVRGKWQYRERPVLINNWEATYFDFNEEKLLSLAKEAARMGVELFVLDDGWFGKRNNDKSSLGDWFVNTRKLPGGLKQLGEEIKKIGLDFGIWVEPEMISMDSELYRRHPEWLVRSPSLPPSPGRNQFLLDLTRQDVKDYLFESLKDVFRSAAINYVKWDMNRNFSDIYSLDLPAERQQEFVHRFTLGLYEIMGKLNKEFPEILFEACASGGNRFDLGMLCYMPQVWTSDNTDAIERLPIQLGTSYFAPPSTMAAHVSAIPNHQVLRKTPIESRYNTAAFGLLGYELDLTKLKSFEKVVVKKQIQYYKEHRKLLQFGRFYRLENPDKRGQYSWMVVSPDREEAMLGWYQELARPNGGTSRIRLSGLDEKALYWMHNRPQYLDLNYFANLSSTALPFDMSMEGNETLIELEKTELSALGDQLMYRGFEPRKQFYGTGMDENISYIGDFGSRLFYIKTVLS